ncbi:hypothetical protein E3O11_09355 [Cryobacterium levicorallinum]|uniref:SipW-cognate class signal peptide n=1 Tax=Cryobacterium levicorallinum TaxID=995038 RepID=A0A1I3DHF3_9MICO|nr:SipW-dependent-type signal peptide-containing protein [Cryobacterium levicorallinum]TFB84715.1 hypothetical protein E3O11_09355 [Cryobacterium levicorallinum]SFH86076.1 SipW-cognate class signal peptide [Cryobacterium levicorallinum]
MAHQAPEQFVDSRQKRNRRIRAVLAGGLVLGLGAAVTLAAWNDSEFARGSFAASGFNLVGSSFPPRPRSAQTPPRRPRSLSSPERMPPPARPALAERTPGTIERGPSF